MTPNRLYVRERDTTVCEACLDLNGEDDRTIYLSTGDEIHAEIGPGICDECGESAGVLKSPTGEISISASVTNVTQQPAPVA